METPEVRLRARIIIIVPLSDEDGWTSADHVGCSLPRPRVSCEAAPIDVPGQHTECTECVRVIKKPIQLVIRGVV